MIELTQALDAIREEVKPLPIEELPLGECLGLVLASDIVSEIDSPPFDKALMDGYAVRSADVSTGRATLKVLGIVTAGQIAEQPVSAGTAIQIMTGTPLPQGADAVVRVEETRREGDVVHIDSRPVTPETNLIRRGASLRAGETILRASERLTPPRIGILAELGFDRVRVRRRPRIAVLSTGDELVPVGAKLQPGQIRNSNEAMLVAQIQAAGAIAVPLGIARDNRADLAGKIQEGLKCDLLVLSGGVSAGKLDLVPAELESAGVRELFHKVNMKPGKPVWFGRRVVSSQESPTFVFGLPGNPVSSMVCFELFVRMAVRQMLGIEPSLPQSLPARLVEDFHHRSDRPTYHPVELHRNSNGLEARLLPWQGSSDLRSTATANGMGILAAGEQIYEQGTTILVLSWE